MTFPSSPVCLFRSISTEGPSLDYVYRMQLELMFFPDCLPLLGIQLEEYFFLMHFREQSSLFACQ